MEFCGELKEDAAWTGRITLSGDVVVPAGRRLRLARGAQLSFSQRPKWSCSVFRSAPEGYPIEATCRQACDIVVLGALECEGARLSTEGQDRWGGITLLERGRAELRDCELAGAVDTAVQCFDESELGVSGGEISGSRVGVLGWGLSRTEASGARFHDCETAVLCREGAFARLKDCDFSRLSEGAWAQQWSLIETSRCRFQDCSNFRAGAYEESRVLLEGRLVAGSEKVA